MLFQAPTLKIPSVTDFLKEKLITYLNPPSYLRRIDNRLRKAITKAIRNESRVPRTATELTATVYSRNDFKADVYLNNSMLQALISDINKAGWSVEITYHKTENGLDGETIYGVFKIVLSPLV